MNRGRKGAREGKKKKKRRSALVGETQKRGNGRQCRGWCRGRGRGGEQSAFDRKKDANDEPYYDFSKTAMDAFLVGRRILENAEQAGELTAAASDALQAQIQIASLTWEKCIAATVVHYINDVRGDMDSFSDGKFADLSNFTNLAKHWGEMKGFALGLQFSPKSPFRDGSVDGIDLDSLKSVLSLMGDAP